MPIKIYLVEDSPVIRVNLVDSLMDIMKADIVGFSDNEAEASLWLSENPWDMVIVDLFLKVGTGMGVIHGCRARNPSQKIIVLSNYATQTMREKSIELGANVFFDKSNEIDQFFDYAIENAAAN